MCGFVARIGPASASEYRRVCAFADRLGHRGPDGAGAFVGDGVTMAHRRLAIVDRFGGAQPMSSSGRTALVFNGEIYNHDALRNRLMSEDIAFQSRSDTEVVLRSAVRWGVDCPGRLDGMFAFVLVQGDRFLAARDALGIKPLYKTREPDGTIWFASEVKGLPASETIEEIGPGSVVTEQGTVQWHGPPWRRAQRAPAESGELRDVLQRAVDKRLMSDVPLGAFLSGGIDSSVVASLMSLRLGEIDTFAVGVDGAPDLEAARQVASHLRSRHHALEVSASDIARAVPEVVEHLESDDVALVRSAVPTFFVARLAAEFVKVVLTGEGADEIFGGYAYFESLDEPEAFHEECVRLLDGLHNLNLQRLDRMTMAHGIEGRVPFLDLEVVRRVMSIDPVAKQWQGGPEKAMLRVAFRDLLPDAILWRRKAEFAAGCGFEPILGQHADALVSDADLRNAREADPTLSKEALWYRRLFEERFPGAGPRGVVGRWRGRAGSSWGEA